MLSAPTRVVVGHPTGNQFFRHLLRALNDAGVLAKACTTIDWRPGKWERVLPDSMRRELGRRRFSTDLQLEIDGHPAREMLRLAASRLGCAVLTRHERGWLSVDAVYRDFDAWMARQLPTTFDANAVYAYEDAAEATFLAAERRGATKIYDLPIAYWSVSRRLLEEEALRWPEWEPTLLGNRDSAAKLERKTREFELADIVICPSRFVAESLPTEAMTARRVVVAPFGSPTPVDQVGVARSFNRPLRVLFVGAMTQRKGLADLFAAMKILRSPNIELVVLGSPVVAVDFYRRQLPGFTYAAPRPHAEVLSLMRTCDVFCLPSIVEGRALVVQEALSSGLPVIVTAHTGTDDVVIDGGNGFVVPIRSPEAIAARIEWFAAHRAAVREFGRAAHAAAARLTWRAYGEAIAQALRN